MTNINQQLKTITATLVSAEVSYNDIRLATQALKDLFCKAVDFDEEEATKQGHIQTAGGRAISIYNAVFCITDMMRTRKFLLGIKEAIEEKLKTSPRKPVTVLYAGSGPFATLLTPLTSLFGPEQLQMVLLEINPHSIDYLKKTIQQFGIEKYISGIEQVDAVRYQVPGKYHPEILLSETMRPGLQKEPQVSIIANLLPQCDQHTILIPESIKVEACLAGNSVVNPAAVMPLKTLLVLDKETATQINMTPVISTGITITIPEKLEQVYSRIILVTTVKVFGEHIIGWQESGITYTDHLLNIDSLNKYPASLLFRFIPDEKPRFELDIL